jgi:hypothetical protein
MEFKLHKFLTIDEELGYSFSIFQIVDDSSPYNNYYFGLYNDDKIVHEILNISENKYIDKDLNLHFIFTQYVQDKPDHLFKDAEDALFCVLKEMYQYDKLSKLKREGANGSR